MHSLATRKKLRISKIGVKNHQWVSKNPSYSSVHKWLDRNFTKRKTCQFCRSKRFVEWALKKNLKHDHVRLNYLCLCSSCHKKYDYTTARRNKLSNSLKGRKITWAKKISKSNMGRIISTKTKEKMSVWHKKNPGKRNNKSGRYE